MFCGIDFGTSNTALAVWRAGRPELVPLEDGATSIPSLMYTPKSVRDTIDIDERELDRRVAVAKAAQTRDANEAKKQGKSFRILSDAQIRSREQGLMRREAIEEQRDASNNQTLSEAIASSEGDRFGKDATLHYINNPDSGFYFKSPKTFLGSKLTNAQLHTFSEIVTRILAHVKSVAEKKLGRELSHVAMGRPIHFHGGQGEAGDAQALSILERAAVSCGFEEIEFLYEPLAAAIEYESKLNRDQVVLVVDIGGGTSDCSMVAVGPSHRTRANHEETVLGYSGGRIGGDDLDIKFAYHEFMKKFGRLTKYKDGGELPASVFWNAVMVNNLPAQKEFQRSGPLIDSIIQKAADPKLLRRLETMHSQKLSHRVVRSAELTKIHLSENQVANVPMDYIEEGWIPRFSRSDFERSVDGELHKFGALMHECVTQAQRKPDAVFVTGGTAKSPVIVEFIEAAHQGVPIVVGDHFGSATLGLATWGNSRFGGRI